MTDRITREMVWIGFLNNLEHRSSCLRGHVGALIIKDNRVVSMGYNGAPPNMIDCYEAGECMPVKVNALSSPQFGIQTEPIEVTIEGCARTIHAEANAIAFAARAGVSTDGCEMWCSYSPCRECAKLVIAAGIKKFTYISEYRLGATELLDDAGLEVIWFAGPEGQDS